VFYQFSFGGLFYRDTDYLEIHREIYLIFKELRETLCSPHLCGKTIYYIKLNSRNTTDYQSITRYIKGYCKNKYPLIKIPQILLKSIVFEVIFKLTLQKINNTPLSHPFINQIFIFPNRTFDK
jgi:hypothetical protein